MGAAVAWFDIASRDPSRLAGFYRELFGWTVTESPDPGYLLVETGAGELGKFAMFADPDGHTLGMWS